MSEVISELEIRREAVKHLDECIDLIYALAGKVHPNPEKGLALYDALELVKKAKDPLIMPACWGPL